MVDHEYMVYYGSVALLSSWPWTIQHPAPHITRRRNAVTSSIKRGRGGEGGFWKYEMGWLLNYKKILPLTVTTFTMVIILSYLIACLEYFSIMSATWSEIRCCKRHAKICWYSNIRTCRLGLKLLFGTFSKLKNTSSRPSVESNQRNCVHKNHSFSFA